LHRQLPQYGLKLADPELACAPFHSAEGQRYFAAMAAAANFAWANRQVIGHLVRGAWRGVLGQSGGSLELIYDVAHNIAKIEEHVIASEAKQPRYDFVNNGIASSQAPRNDVVKLCVHRKGATRAFGPGSGDVPADYRSVGQPILIPGTMGTASYILVGTPRAEETFFSVCHGAGRVMSRHAALRIRSGQAVKEELESQGIVVRSFSTKGLAEEAPLAYKDINNVVEVVVKAGLAKLVARLKPLGVVKG
jgi:tRNA-splicing ligase RtcB